MRHNGSATAVAIALGLLLLAADVVVVGALVALSEGAGGWIFVTRGKLEASNPALLTEPLSAAAPRLYASDNHMGNFFDCIRSRQQPICDAEIGHRSVSVCHLGVISIRLGRKLHWDPEREQFDKDPEANRWLAREQRKPWTYDMA